jgi:Fibrobacter succinogenes major domain (Fib_succ_major).
MINQFSKIPVMTYLNKLTDDDIPIPITHICKPERLGKDMTGLELHEFGLALFMTFLWVLDSKLVIDSRNIAPLGWHIPTNAEWTALTDYLGGESVAGGKMKSTSGWAQNDNGTNSSGFTALPSGFRFYGEFQYIGIQDRWWTPDEYDVTTAYSNLVSWGVLEYFK